jgi:tRNA-Thr(GGU) m(6)t(6)A37 methyltransferase TsaA
MTASDTPLYSLHPIAIAHTPFKEKFAIPRQPGLATAATGEVELLPPYNQSMALEGLEQVSHIWLIFLFHQSLLSHRQPPKLKVRPPRLGGNESLGVFATRSNFRPNGLGQSLVKLESIQGSNLMVSGLDLLDQTPILDIKPYVPYSDCRTEATNQIAPEPPLVLAVNWQAEAKASALRIGEQKSVPLLKLIEQCLAQDPKPAYQQPDTDRIYGTRLWETEVQWRYLNNSQILVVRVGSGSPT